MDNTASRYYAPPIGRFISRDPTGLNGGQNTYEYARADPIDLTDPTGMATELAPAELGPALPFLILAAEIAGGIILSVLGSPLVIAFAVGVAVGVIVAMAVKSDSGLIEDEEANAERERYKKICRQQAPPGLNPCEKAIWDVDRANQCLNLREAWDARWKPGDHAQEIENQRKALENALERMKKFCGELMSAC